MGGKSYYCDYCCCFIKNNINVRKAHNSGLAHTNAKLAFLRPYEDAKIVLTQEIAKGPCIHYHRGYCKFDFLCQFSHYTEHELNELRKIAHKREQRLAQSAKKLKNPAPAWKEKLPWHAGKLAQKNLSKKCRKHLPPSLKEIEFHKLKDYVVEEWG